MILCTLLLAILSPQEDLDAILENMRKKARAVQTMVADYEQVKTLSLLEEDTRSRGKLYFDRRRDTTRWQSEDGTIQQLKGNLYIAVFPGLKEVEIYPLDEKGSVVAAIMGSPDADLLKKEFEVALTSSTEEAIELKLLPRAGKLKKRILEARIEVNPRTHLIRAAVYTEKNGDTVRIRFQDMKLNGQLSEQTFDLDLDDLRAKGYNIREHK